LDEILEIFSDPLVEEVLLQQGYPICLFRNGKFAISDSTLKQPHSLKDLLHELAIASQTRLDYHNPSAGGIMQSGEFRWHCLIPPIVPKPFLSIRRHQFDQLAVEDFELSNEEEKKIHSFAFEGKSLVISGPTGSGKTSFMVGILKRYCHKERLVIIEQIDEIPILSPLWQKLITSPKDIKGHGGVDSNELFVHSLRIRPQRYVVGEIRSEEAAVFVESTRSGHLGSIATVHAGSLGEAKDKLCELASISQEKCGSWEFIQLPHR